MRDAGVGRLVFSSTCATFGPPERVPIDETLPQRPINPYGESKLLFEKILRWYDEIHGLKFVALRYFNAAGATEKFGEDHRCETHLIPNVLKVALGQKPHVEIYGTDYETPDGTCIRDYIHILDLSRAHILALGAKKSAFYNLGTGGGIERARSDRHLPRSQRPRNSGGRKTAPARRSAATRSPRRRKSNASSAGSRSFENLARSSRARGVGTKNSRTATEINEPPRRTHHARAKKTPAEHTVRGRSNLTHLTTANR